MDDLINEQMGYAKHLEANYDNSHFGLPSDNNIEFKDFINYAIPDIDPYQLFGFNSNIDNYLNEREANTLFR